MPDARNLGPKQRDVLLALERGEHALAWTAAEPGRGPQFVWSDGRVEDPRVVNSLEDRGLITCEADHGLWLTRAGLEWVAAYHRERHEACLALAEAKQEVIQELLAENARLRAELVAAVESGLHHVEWAEERGRARASEGGER